MGQKGVESSLGDSYRTKLTSSGFNEVTGQKGVNSSLGDIRTKMTRSGFGEVMGQKCVK